MRLAYLTVANTFAVLGLLLATDRDKNTEILVLRHQVGVLERQLGGKKVRFSPADRAWLAALLHRLRPHALGRMRFWSWCLWVGLSAGSPDASST
jgi:hypothetical protein